MPTKAEVTVVDEHGDRWKVGAGDPALKHVNTLRAKGFGLVVLPRRTLTTGTISGTMEVPLADLDDAAFVRAVRHNLCLHALGGETDG